MFEKTVWYADYYRTTDDKEFHLLHFLRDFIFQHRLRFILFFRYAQTTKSKLLKLLFDYKLYRLSRRFGIEIKSKTRIGKGFVLLHPYNITVAPASIIGENVTMLKGSTLGLSHGKAPTIGDYVYIGLNSTILGGVTIGDNVVIAPNTFIDFNVPSNSIVVGSPGIIIPKENPTKELIWKTL